MFTGELAESRQTEVVIRDIDERAMELLIDFAYTSQVTIVTALVAPVEINEGFTSEAEVFYLCIIFIYLFIYCPMYIIRFV